MIDALIAGKLHGKPTQRTGPSGKTYIVCKVRTPLADGEAIFINVMLTIPASEAGQRPPSAARQAA